MLTCSLMRRTLRINSTLGLEPGVNAIEIYPWLILTMLIAYFQMACCWPFALGQTKGDALGLSPSPASNQGGALTFQRPFTQLICIRVAVSNLAQISFHPNSLHPTCRSFVSVMSSCFLSCARVICRSHSLSNSRNTQHVWFSGPLATVLGLRKPTPHCSIHPWKPALVLNLFVPLGPHMRDW